MKKRQKGNTRLDIEVDYGFNLFLHQRDFMAGYPIIHCINHGIEKSRRVIFILSRYLTKNHSVELFFQFSDCLK